MSGASRLATAPIPSSSLIFSINLPRFSLLADNFFRFASALIISPETNTGPPRFAATLDARLLPAPGIPTTTITVFCFALSMHVSADLGEETVIALKSGGDYLRQRFVRGPSPKLHLYRPRRSTDSISHNIDPVISSISGRRFETCRTREHPSHVEISRNPGVGPEHAFLMTAGRAKYVTVSDEEALEAFKNLSQLEGIMPALESAHAISYAMKLAKSLATKDSIIVNLSGNGDKDVEIIAKHLPR